MASWKDSVLHWKRKLEKGVPDEKVLDIFSKLQRVPITVELLQETGIGKVVNTYRKRDGEISKRAAKVIAEWKQIVCSGDNKPAEETTRYPINGDASDYVPSNKYLSRTSNSSPKTGLHKYGTSKEDSYDPRSATDDYRNFKEKDGSRYNPNSTQEDYRKFLLTYQDPGNSSTNGDFSGKKDSKNNYLESCDEELESRNYSSSSKHSYVPSASSNLDSSLNISNKTPPDKRKSYEVSELETRNNFGSSKHSYMSSVSSDLESSRNVSTKLSSGKKKSYETSELESRSSSSSSKHSHMASALPDLGSSRNSSNKKSSEKKKSYETSELKSGNSSSSSKHPYVPTASSDLESSRNTSNKKSSEKKKFYDTPDARNNSKDETRKKIKTEPLSDEGGNLIWSDETPDARNSSKDETRKKIKTEPLSEEGGNLILSDSKSSKHKHKSKHKDRTKPDKKLKGNPATDGFNSSVASFEACLGFNDSVTTVKVKTKTSSSKQVSDRSSKSSSEKVKKMPVSQSSNSKKSGQKEMSGSSHKSSKDKRKKNEFPDALIKPVLKPLEQVDVLSTLPEIQPEYKPLRMRVSDSPPPKKKALMSNEEAIAYTSSRKDRTAVYAGRRHHFDTEVPSLFDNCVRVLIENIDGIGFTGGVPYSVLKPILEKCTPVQLYTLEDDNNYLLEDTNDLWEVHLKRDFKARSPEEGETWRDLYLRLYDEREAKLKSVTANISASMAKATPVRQTKLAYVDSVAKPPRNVARKQARYGTGLPVSHPVKAGPPGQATPRPTAPAINAANAVASSSSSSSSLASHSQQSQKKQVVKVAPLMQKTLKFMKQRFRR